MKSAAGSLTIGKLEGFGPAAYIKLVKQFETLGHLMDASEADLTGVVNISQRNLLMKSGRADLQTAYAVVEKELTRLNDDGAFALSIYDDAYPERLKAIPNAPMVVYGAGDLAVLDKSVSCVGTREPDRFGAVVAQRTTKMLAENGFTIVSGLAQGIDSIAHWEALNADAPTVAVLGCGLDQIRGGAFDLYQAIGTSAGGAILTEQPLGQQSDRNTLSRRNRIITGVSLATFVYQCAQESGTMHSIKYALRQGKPMFVPQIPETFAKEPLNHTAINMANMSPADFARLCDWRKEYLDAAAESTLTSVADSISGKEDYPHLVERLKNLHAGKNIAADQENKVVAAFA